MRVFGDGFDIDITELGCIRLAFGVTQEAKLIVGLNIASLRNLSRSAIVPFAHEIAARYFHGEILYWGSTFLLLITSNFTRGCRSSMINIEHRHEAYVPH
jgi:hypothetical protein